MHLGRRRDSVKSKYRQKVGEAGFPRGQIAFLKFQPDSVIALTLSFISTPSKDVDVTISSKARSRRSFKL